MHVDHHGRTLVDSMRNEGSIIVIVVVVVAGKEKVRGEHASSFSFACLKCVGCTRLQR